MSHDRQQRDPALREAYLGSVLDEVPRLLGAVDRCPVRKTYGCFDREYWHYRTGSFPSEMYQEAVLPLALLATTPMPGNVWYEEPLLRELAVAGIRFSARSSHADGSCDDYYPYERALGAAVFSLQAATRAYQLLELDDPELVAWFIKRGEWIAGNDESGRLTNHHALAALGLARVAEITGQARFRQAAEARIRRVLAWQHEEGWFDEYGGADPGYQTVTIECLAQYREMIKHAGGQAADQSAGADKHAGASLPVRLGPAADALDEPLCRAVRFARHFLRPDHGYGGECGSRGTRHFYPHGMELLAAEDRAAAELADGFLKSFAQGTAARFGDDRMVVHRLASMIEAWRDWSPSCPAAEPEVSSAIRPHFFPAAGILVQTDRTSGNHHIIISAARGGTFQFFGSSKHADAGLVLETTDGKIAVSQQHGYDRPVHFEEDTSKGDWMLTVEGPLHRVRFETATPLKQILLFGFMLFIGRWCRRLVRRLLQKRLITGHRPGEIRLKRTFERHHDRLTVTDRITLTGPRITVRRMSYAVDFEAKYTAASDVFQKDVLQGWCDLGEHAEELNEKRAVTITRTFLR